MIVYRTECNQLNHFIVWNSFPTKHLSYFLSWWDICFKGNFSYGFDSTISVCFSSFMVIVMFLRVDTLFLLYDFTKLPSFWYSTLGCFFSVSTFTSLHRQIEESMTCCTHSLFIYLSYTTWFWTSWGTHSLPFEHICKSMRTLITNNTE